jgi:hypothetical protein
VSSLRPRQICGASVHDHPAVAAWSRLQAVACGVRALEVWRETTRHEPASVYRLELSGGGSTSVFAKRCDAASGAVERACYEDIVPQLDLSSPVYYGSLSEPDGTCWLFLEDVGRERLSGHDPTHRMLASRWLGRLHRLGARLEAARRLPEGGPLRYLAHLKNGRARILRSFDNPALTAEDRELLALVLPLLDRVEGAWGVIERACMGLPETIVHGDFRPKNVRVREESAGPVLYALDWELGGWGVPVVDLTPADGFDTTLQLDAELYAAELRGDGPALRREDVVRLSHIGFLLRRLAAIDWETLSLHFEDPRSLIGPTMSIRSLHRELLAGVDAAQPWLR